MIYADIEEGFEAAMQKALFPYRGMPITKDLKDEMQQAVMKAARDYYFSIPEIYKDEHEIKMPRPQVTVEGSVVTIRGRI